MFDIKERFEAVFDKVYRITVFLKMSIINLILNEI